MKIDGSSFRPTVASMLGAIVIVALLAAGLVATKGSQDKQLFQDQKEIKAVVLQAFELTHGGTTMLPEPYYSDPATSVPEEVIAQMNEQASERLAEVYSEDSPLMSNRIDLMQREIGSQAPPSGYRDLGGGMRWIRNITIEVNGDTAVMEADVRTWGRFMDQGMTFAPESSAHHRWVLAREDGIWKITQEEFTFWPGEEP